MPIDNRDWYRDSLRKKTGYVERASFRVPLGTPEQIEARKRARGWRRNFLIVCLLIIVAVAFFNLETVVSVLRSAG